MRKLLLLAIGAMLMMQLTPANAADAKSGTILLPTPIAASGSDSVGTFECNWVQDSNCEKGNFTGLHRRAYLVGGEAVNGILGVTFPITATGVAFTLGSVPANTADFDITFYRDLGALPNTNPTAYCSPAPCGPQTSFGKLGNGNETGIVPVGTTFAIVSCTCVNAAFQYNAG